MTYVVPILHPAYIMLGLFGLEPAQVLYLKRVRRVLDGWDPPIPPIEPGPPGCITRPTSEDMADWRAALASLPDQTVTVDIENAGPHILCIGFCRVADLVAISIPFRKKGGAPWWFAPFLPLVIEWVDEILSNPEIPKVFHNGQAHDVPILERTGFVVRGFTDDTMLMQHVCYPEMPKKLEFLGILYAGMPAWKWLSKGTEEEGEGK